MSEDEEESEEVAGEAISLTFLASSFAVKVVIISTDACFSSSLSPHRRSQSVSSSSSEILMIPMGIASRAKGRAEAAANRLPYRDGSRIVIGASADDQNGPALVEAIEIIDISEEDKEEDDAILKSRLTAHSRGCGDSSRVTPALYPSHTAT